MVNNWLILPLLYFSVHSKAYTSDIWGIESKKIYSFHDLELLCSDKQYEQYFAHISDIAPSQRNSTWNECTRTLSLEYLKKLSAIKKLSSIDLNRIESLNKIQINHSSSEFKNRRDSLGLKYFVDCFKANNKNCSIELSRFWQSAPSKIDTLLQFTPYFENNWIVFKHILQKPRAEIYCLKPIIQNSIINQFSLVNESDPDNFIIKVDSLIHPSCWKSIIPILKNRLAEAKNEDSIKNIRRILQFKNQIKSPPNDYKVFSNYFKNLTPGDEFNEAWSFIQKLKKSKANRVRLAKWIEENPMMPIDLFENPNKFYRQTLLKHLYNSFPEFFSSFTNKCLQIYATDKQLAEECAQIVLSEENKQFFAQKLRQKAQLILPSR